MENNNKFYFAIKDIECEFSPYGNDVDWSGCVIDADNNIVNDYLSIKTCEMASDPYECIYEEDVDNEIFNEDGEIVNQEKYDEEVQAYEEMMIDGYYEMDCDHSESIEINGTSYVKISLRDFVDNHQLGEVGSFERDEIPSDLDTVEDINQFASKWYVYLGDWSKRVITTIEFEMDEVDDNSVTGWVTFSNEDTYYTSFIGSYKDPNKQKQLESCGNDDEFLKNFQHRFLNTVCKLCEDGISLQTLVDVHNFAQESVTGVTDLYVAYIMFDD